LISEPSCLATARKRISKIVAAEIAELHNLGRRASLAP
jgi:hypothetical protein